MPRQPTKRKHLLQLANKMKRPFLITTLAERADCTGAYCREVLIDEGFDIVEMRGNAGLWFRV